MNNSATKFCPVPLEQQPSYEYQQLRDSWFFSWATLPRIDYVTKILWVGLAMSPIVAPIAAVSFLPAKFPLKFTISTVTGIVFLTSLVLLQLYFGWLHVKTVFNNHEFLMRSRDGTTDKVGQNQVQC